MIDRVKRIGVAIAFSPRIEAILFETARIKNMLNAELILVHVGSSGLVAGSTQPDRRRPGGGGRPYGSASSAVSCV